jgi:hypothetical protein
VPALSEFYPRGKRLTVRASRRMRQPTEAPRPDKSRELGHFIDAGHAKPTGEARVADVNCPPIRLRSFFIKIASANHCEWAILSLPVSDFSRRQHFTGVGALLSHAGRKPRSARAAQAVSISRTWLSCRVNPSRHRRERFPHGHHRYHRYHRRIHLLHPFTKCRVCNGTARHYAKYFPDAHRRCRKCGGTGRKDRLGVRLFMKS